MIIFNQNEFGFLCMLLCFTFYIYRLSILKIVNKCKCGDLRTNHLDHYNLSIAYCSSNVQFGTINIRCFICFRWVVFFLLVSLFVFCSVNRLSDQTPKNARFICAIILVIINSALFKRWIESIRLLPFKYIPNGMIILHIMKPVQLKPTTTTIKRYEY